MNYSKKDVLIGFVIILIIIAGAFYYRIINNPKVLPSPTPVEISYQEDFENKFKFDIPDNANTLELKDVSGGNGRGLATNKEILADVENPQSGYFYQGWIEDNDKLTSLGKLIEAKGGWILKFPEISNTNNKKIIISLENKLDNKIEKRILEGSFN
ncbi:MAG: hypothetical protein ACD_19C00182G0022 [uncultured bacterium]|nr:MAG: hypothetical protein ACD_19C00182G0022 [uncultured bacterium]